jgi:hypothetical protein
MMVEGGDRQRGRCQAGMAHAARSRKEEGWWDKHSYLGSELGRAS